MIKTKYTGVYYRENQQEEKIFYITYKIGARLKREKIGSNKEGITAAYCSKMRAKQTSIDRLKDDAPLNIKIIPSFDEVANEYFEYKKDIYHLFCFRRRENYYLRKFSKNYFTSR